VIQGSGFRRDQVKDGLGCGPNKLAVDEVSNFVGFSDHGISSITITSRSTRNQTSDLKHQT
jgi:hypothetical protein